MTFHALATAGYVFVIFYILQFPQQSRYAIILGIVTTAFIAVGYILRVTILNEAPGIPLDRGLSILSIWLTVYFSHRLKKLLDMEVRHREQLHAVFANATEGMLIVDMSGEIVLINSFAEKLFGYKSGELVGARMGDLLPEWLRAVHETRRHAFMAVPENRPMGQGKELMARRKDGSELPVEISLGHFKNTEGSFAIAFILDLSERRLAIETLNHEQKLATTYFELAPVLFVALDRAGTIISMNEYGCKLLGYRKEEVVGKNWFNMFLPDEIQDDIVGYFGKMIRNTQSDLQYENPVLNKLGVEIDMSWRNTLIHGIHGLPLVVLAAGTDISERKRQDKLTIAHHLLTQNLNDELELRIRNRTTELNEAVNKLRQVNRELVKNQHLFKAIAHHFPDSVIGVLNKDLKYIFADGQELRNIGLIKKDNRGERVFDNMHPALSSEAEVQLKKVFGGTRVSYEVEINKKAYTVSSVPLPDETGQINEIIVVIKNIAEQKRIEKDLVKSIERERELNEMKSKFVTMASHEFRTPLSTILSSVFLLENYAGEELEKNRESHLTKIRRSVNNLTDLLNDFMSLGKLEEGRIKVTYSELDIRDFLEELVPEMELIRKGNQMIRCACTGDELEVQLDRQLLRSIILNLVGNAIKYSSMDADIELKVVVTEADLMLRVIDHGMGIPLEEQRHIFKRFYRAQNAANIEGTGLGLNIVKKYVRLMKGRIEFHSKLNEGTTFTVTLPRLKNSPEEYTEHQKQNI